MKAPSVLLMFALGLGSASPVRSESPSPTPVPAVVTPMPPGGLSVGPASKPSPADGGSGGMEAAVAGLLQAMQGGGTNNPLARVGGRPVVDFREIQALLPAEVGGLRRTGARGEKAGFMGVNVAIAEGEYGDPQGPRFEVKISDLGGMGVLGTLAGMGWMAGEIDAAGDRGYERTVDYQGHKGHEKYDKATRSGTAMAVVANRFLVEIEGHDIEAEQLRGAMGGVNIGALGRLADAPGEP